MKRKKGNIRVEDNDFSLVDDGCLAHYCLPGSREASSVQQILTNALKRNDFQHLHGLICFRIRICEIEGKKEERIYLLSTDTRQFTHIDAKHQWDEAISKARKAKSEQGQPKRRRREQPRIFTSNVHGDVYGGGMKVQPLPQSEQQGGNLMPTEEVMPPWPQQGPEPACTRDKKICGENRLTPLQSSQGEVAPPPFMQPDPTTTSEKFPRTQGGYWQQFASSLWQQKEQGGHSK